MYGQWQHTGGLKGQVICFAYKFSATWRWPTFIQVTRANSRNRFAIDDSTANVVHVMIMMMKMNIITG